MVMCLVVVLLVLWLFTVVVVLVVWMVRVVLLLMLVVVRMYVCTVGIQRMVAMVISGVGGGVAGLGGVPTTGGSRCALRGGMRKAIQGTS